MEYKERGKIEYRKRRQQIIDFSGIRFRTCKGIVTPTDLEGFFEIQNRVFVFIELKLEGTDMPNGQRKAFERLIGAIIYPAILIVAWHKVYDCKKDIIAHLTIVKKWYWNEGLGTIRWHEPRKEFTLKYFLDMYLKRHYLFSEENVTLNNRI